MDLAGWHHYWVRVEDGKGVERMEVLVLEFFYLCQRHLEIKLRVSKIGTQPGLRKEKLCHVSTVCCRDQDSNLGCFGHNEEY